MNSTGNTLTFHGSKWTTPVLRLLPRRRLEPAPGREAERLVAGDLRDQDEPEQATGYTGNPETITLNIPDAVAQTRRSGGSGSSTAPTRRQVVAGRPRRSRSGSATSCSSAPPDRLRKLRHPEVPPHRRADRQPDPGQHRPRPPVAVVAHDPPVGDRQPDVAGLCTNGVDGALTAPNGAVTLVPASTASTPTPVWRRTSPPRVWSRRHLRPGRAPGNTTDRVRPDGGSANRTLPITAARTSTTTCSPASSPTARRRSTTSPGSYTGGVVLDEILNSPRFFYVPVLAISPPRVAPDVLDRRLPAGVHHRRDRHDDRDQGPTRARRQRVSVQGNDIKQIKVVFFNKGAADEGDIPIIDYLGVGNRSSA